MNICNHESTEGEKIIEIFLDIQDIKFSREVKISKLKNDYADYRVADFYIPKYKVYLEFLGRWDSDKEKYLKKMEVYEKNNIPCIYIFPNNLGILEFIFRWRLEKELKKYPELKFQLLKYKLWRFNKFFEVSCFLFVVMIFLSIILENMLSKRLFVGSITVIVSIITCIFIIIFGIKNLFFKK